MKRLKKIWRRKKKGIKAHIDRVEEGKWVHGWAMDAANPERKVTVEILVDDQPAATIVADQYRYDLSQQFGGDGKWGFVVELDLRSVVIDGGVISLREKISSQPLSVNPVSLIQFNLSWIRRMRQEYLDRILESGEVEGSLLLAMKEEAYGQLAKKLKQKIKVDDIFKNGDALILLAILLAGEELIEALALYRRIVESDAKVEKSVAHRMMLDFTGELWRYPPGDYVDPWSVRRLEILQEVLGLADRSELPSFNREEEAFENLMAHMIRAGRVMDSETMERLHHWVTGKPFDAFYPSFIGTVLELQDHFHRADNMFLVKLNQSMEICRGRNATSPFIRAYAIVLMEYMELMTNLDFIAPEKIEELMRTVERELSVMLGDEWRIELRKMEWLYRLGERWKALKIFRFFLEKGIDYLDWRCRYFPELLWLHFLDRDREIDDRNLLDFIYKRQEEDRCSFEESVVLLSDLLRWRDNAGLGKVQSIVQRTLEGIYGIDDPEKIKTAYELIHRLTKGSYDDYFRRALEISNVMETEKSLDSRYHHATLFEDQNLYTLAMSLSVPPEECGRYAALTVSCDTRKSDKEPPAFIQTVCTYAEAAMFGRMKIYFHSLLRRMGDEHLKIFLFTEEKVLLIEWVEEKVVEHLLSDGKTADLKGRIWLLAPSHLLHHASLEAEISWPCELRDSGEEEGSYLLDTDTWEKYSEESNSPLTWKSIRRIRSEIHEDLTRFKVETFKKMEPALLSFKNIEGDALERLVDFSRPLLKVNMDETIKAMEYLSELYEEKRVETPESVNLEETVLIRIKKARKSMDRNDLACFLVQRNEYMRLEGFFDYYRRMGVSRFYVIDNASDDGKTLDLLLDQEDVELYSTPQAYSQSLYGVRWAELLIKAKRVGRWNLVLDADEILMLDENYPDLPSLCRALEEENCDALYTPFVDMYSDKAINRTPYRPGTEILKECGFHDRHFFTTYYVYGGIIGNTLTYFGGVRSRIFGLDRVVLNKFPLFRFYPRMRLREGLHWIDYARYKMGKAVLLHFKYIETFHEYVEREIARGQHWNGASEYRKYHEMLRNDPDFSLYDPVLSVRFTGVRDFYERFGSDKNVGTKEREH